MKHHYGPLWLLFTLLLNTVFFIPSAESETKAMPISITPIQFHGWQHAIKMSNTDVEVVIVPEIGRIMHYSEPGKANWLHIDPSLAGITLADGKPRTDNGKPVYTAFGGDRVWTYQEDQFVRITGTFRPADYYIDGLPWQAAIAENSVVLTSPISRFSGIQVVRKLRLSTSGTELFIEQKIVKKHIAQDPSIEPVKVTLWNLTVIENHQAIVFELANNDLFPKDNGLLIPDWDGDTNHARKNLVRDGNLVALKSTGDDKFQKIGGNGNGWIAGIRGEQAMVETFTYDASATYPDGGTSVTTFMTKNTGELECLSPHTLLKLGESLTFNITWQLIPAQGNSLNEKMKAIQSWYKKES